MSENFVKLDRKILTSGFLKNHTALAVFCFMLVKASWRREQEDGIWLERGELATNYQIISQETGLTYKQARMAIGFLEKRGTLGRKSGTIRAADRAGTMTIFIVKNYDFYQSRPKEKAGSKAPSWAGSRAGSGQHVGSSSINREEVKKGAHAQGTQNIRDAMRDLQTPEGFDSWPMAQQVAYWGQK